MVKKNTCTTIYKGKTYNDKKIKKVWLGINYYRYRYNFKNALPGQKYFYMIKFNCSKLISKVFYLLKILKDLRN